VEAGVVISASHNPVEFNGIKFFDGNGYKLPDSMEDEIEALIRSGMQGVEFPTGSRVGKIKYRTDAREEYINHAIQTVPVELSGMKIVVDCAEGAAHYTSVEALRQLGAEVVPIHNMPDGTNINANCGSTHMGELQARVVYEKAKIGLAFDGDADRLLAVDELGNIVDGDQIMAACGLDRKGRGALPGDTVVATVMSNLGLHVFAKEHGLKLEITDVGDRNVLERMLEQGYVLGGEQSGHMIFTDYATTGDGQLTALQVLSLLKESGKKASELFGACARYPQVLINVPVADNDVKKAVMASQALWDAVKAEEEQLAGSGRILVRPSGTEALIRVMVEAQTGDEARAVAEFLANVIKNS